ncbi:hypothetical protein FQA39_LY11649 [Lamprigera yunnana]|nr:hypothetical protein FQA39_LY11649 [Lamprigera yunnana]
MLDTSNENYITNSRGTKFLNKKGENHSLPQIIAILAGSISSLSCGLLFAWTAPSIPKLIDDSTLTITLEQASYFTVIPPVFMGIGVFLCPKIMDRFGIKISIMITAIFQLLSWILIGIADGIWVFYIARIMYGVSDAFVFGVIPVYVCEIALPDVRGSWGTLVAINVFVGIFLINAINIAYNIKQTAIICGSLPLLQLLLLIFIPESPYYLIAKGEKDKAKKSLQILRWRTDVEDELGLLESDVQRQISESALVKSLFNIRSNRKALLLCLSIRTVQQFSGLPAFETYSSYMFQQETGMLSEEYSTLVFTGATALVTVLSGLIIEKIGRKPLLLFSCFGCAVILGIESIYFGLKYFSNIDLISVNWIPLMGMLLFTVVNSLGLAVIPTLIVGELFSTSVKSKAYKTNSNYLWIFAVAALFLLIFIPESPYDLIAKRKKDIAKKLLQILQWMTDVEDELGLLESDVKRQMSEPALVKSLFNIRSNRKALLLCLSIRTVQQFNGYPAFAAYSSYMFQQETQILTVEYSTLVFNGATALSAALSGLIIEKTGRKPLIVFSCFGCAVILGIEIIYFGLKYFSVIDLISVNWIPLTGMLLFTVVNSSGLAVIPTLIVGELFSTSVKSKAVTMDTFGVARSLKCLGFNIGVRIAFLDAHMLCLLLQTLEKLYEFQPYGLYSKYAYDGKGLPELEY